MKNRALTSLAIVLILALLFVLKALVPGGNYIFDIFIVIITSIAAYESAKIIKQMDKPCYKYLATAFPALIYVNHILGFLYDAYIGLTWTILIDICLVILAFGGAFLYGLACYKRLKKEIRIKKLEVTPVKLSFQRSFNTLVALIYPTFLLMFITIINHIGDFTKTFANANLESYGQVFSIAALLFVFVIPASTDTFAYLMGGAIGGKKLCPKISPKKTISGAIGGVVWCVIISVCAYLILNAIPSMNIAFSVLNFQLWHIILISLFGSVISQLGDLFESFLKRQADVKDSGKILPGHGGMLDRCDSYIFVVPYLMLAFSILLLCL